MIRQSGEVTLGRAANADGHGIVPDGFVLKISVGAQFPCTVLLASVYQKNGRGDNPPDATILSHFALSFLSVMEFER